MRSAPMICLEGNGLRFAHRDRPVLNGASLAIVPGEIVSLLGANGAGKSTLLRLLLGLLKPQSGTVRLNGQALPELGRRQIARYLAYVPQIHTAPFPYQVQDVIMLGLWPETGFLRNPSLDDEEKIIVVLERLGIAHLARRPYTEISGGEQQLALIGRALVQGARILIMDEPMSGLDYGHQIRLIEHLQELAEEGRSVLMSTHHPEQALWASTRVALLHAGRIEADGLPGDVLTREAMHRLYQVEIIAVNALDGRMAFLPARRDRHAGVGE